MNPIFKNLISGHLFSIQKILLFLCIFVGAVLFANPAYASISISGTVYTDEGVTAMGSGRTINVSVNGAASSGSTTTASDGSYTVVGITAASGAVLTVYLQGNTEVGVTVTKSTGSDISGISIYQDHLNIRSDNGVGFTGTNLNTSDNNSATGISAIYSATSITISTFVSGKHLLIMSGQNFSPGAGTQISLFGNWINLGTFTSNNGTVFLRGTGSQILTSGGSSFNTVTINSAGGTYTLQDNLSVSTLSLSNGTLDVSSNNYDLTVATNWNSGGIFIARHGTVNFTRVVSNTQTLNAATGVFYNLNHSGAGTLQLITSNLVVTNNLINSGILDTNGKDISITGNFSNSGTFTASTGTVTLTGTAQILSGSTTFYNLTKSVSSADTLTFTDGTTQTVSNNLTLQGASGQLLTLAGTSTGGWTISVPSTFTLDYLSVSYGTATTNTAAAIHSTDGGNNTNWTFGAGNSAPAISAGPSDGGSYSGAPTNVGSNVTFTATATDANSDNYYLAVCKTNSVTVVNSGAPTCGGGSWAISTSTASGAQASVVYTTLAGDSATNAWFAFVCDNNSSSLCSSSSQGSGNNGSPFVVNHAPTFTSVSNTSGFIKSASNVTFTSVSSDPDSDNVQLFICKATDFTGTACGAGGTYCSSFAGASNPSCNYTVGSDIDGSHTYYANLIDAFNFASVSNPRSSSFSTDITSPTVDAGTDFSHSSSFTQNATASDATSGIVSYAWTQVSGTGTITFGTSTTEDTTVSANINDTYVIRLTVTDTAGNSGSDTASLIWTGSTPPATATPTPTPGGSNGAIQFLGILQHQSTPPTLTLPPGCQIPNLFSATTGLPCTTQPPTQTPISYTFPRYLGRGDTGPDVLNLQQLLQSLSFFPITTTPNGIFGPITKAPVKRFQQAHRIQQTGNVGPLTLKALNGL